MCGLFLLGKYDPLGAYLARKRADTLELTFAELERIIGAFLPKGAQRSEWWTNDFDAAPQAVQIQAWLGAGYDATLLRGERVRFDRQAPAAS